jgi:hypothetical protein
VNNLRESKNPYVQQILEEIESEGSPQKKWIIICIEGTHNTHFLGSLLWVLDFGGPIVVDSLRR